MEVVCWMERNRRCTGGQGQGQGSGVRVVASVNQTLIRIKVLKSKTHESTSMTLLCLKWEESPH